MVPSDSPVEADSCRVFLSIVDSAIAPSEISRRLGLVPERVLEKGEPMPRPLGVPPDVVVGTRMAKINRWTYRVQLDESRPIEDHFAVLASAIYPIASELKEMSATSMVTIEVDMDYSSTSGGNAPTSMNRGITLEPEMVRVIAECGASVDFDLSFE